MPTDSVSSEGPLSGSQMAPCCAFLWLEEARDLSGMVGGVAFGRLLKSGARNDPAIRLFSIGSTSVGPFR